MMTDAVLKYIRTIDELMYYDSHNYHEVSWDGFNALIIDINPDYYCESLKMTNREIILAGGAPVSSDHNDEPFVIHHIGQKQDSPFAIIPAPEHRKFSAIFHQGSPDPDLHGPQFQARKRAFWLKYLEECGKVRSYNQMPYLNPKAKQKHLYGSLEANG